MSLAVSPQTFYKYLSDYILQIIVQASPLDRRFRLVFNKYDSDKDGFISLDKLKPLLSEVCVNLPIPELQYDIVYNALDKVGDGFASLYDINDKCKGLVE